MRNQTILQSPLLVLRRVKELVFGLAGTDCKLVTVKRTGVHANGNYVYRLISTLSDIIENNRLDEINSINLYNTSSSGLDITIDLGELINDIVTCGTSLLNHMICRVSLVRNNTTEVLDIWLDEYEDDGINGHAETPVGYTLISHIWFGKVPANTSVVEEDVNAYN